MDQKRKAVFSWLLPLGLLFLCHCSHSPRFTVIAHRGASADLPEHTLEAYELAIQQGADYIEPDLVVTRDGVMVARHENEITDTTDVAQVFPQRKRTKVIDGKSRTGWFIEDFTWSEVQKLRAVQRLAFRDQTHNRKYKIPSFDQIVALAGDRVGIYPEIKQPEYFESLGLDPSAFLISLQEKSNRVFIQSFSEKYLRTLQDRVVLPLVYLIDDEDTSVKTLNLKRLKQIREFATVLGLSKVFLLQDPGLVARAHAADLQVHIWTMRNEERFVPKQFSGDVLREFRHYQAMGIDGAFWDSPATGAKARR